MLQYIRDKSQLRSGKEVEVIIKYKRMKNFDDCRQILNIIFKRIMNELHLVKFGRSDYNPQKVIKIQQHKYVFSCSPFSMIRRENGIFRHFSGCLFGQVALQLSMNTKEEYNYV